MTALFTPATESSGNRFLDLLPAETRERIISSSERVRVPARMAVAEPGEPIRQVYFPLSSVYSAIVSLSDGSAIEVATIGNDGLTGIDLLSGLETSVYRMIQHVEGESLQMRIAVFQKLIAEEPPLRRLLERYATTVLLQAAQGAACNLRHDIEARMCRWLLMTYDRSRRCEFGLTQEFFGTMLGVRRQSVNMTAAILQKAGLICYRRARIQILDRRGLEQKACECYGAINANYRQIMQCA